MAHTAPFTDRFDPLAGVSPEVLTVTDLIRTGRAVTRQALAEATGMGRNTISVLVNEAVRAGLLVPDGSAPSTGGRAPATWRFRAETGLALSVGVHTTTLRLAVTDLGGQPLEERTLDWPITCGPEATLEEAARHLAEMASHYDEPAWAAGVSLPGPIDQESGRPTSPPIMPGWDGFDVIGVLGGALRVPVVTDNDVNMMLLGYATSAGGPAGPPSRRAGDLLYVQIGTGIGAGLMSHGRLHRGADGAAGDIGHVRVSGSDTIVCRCGRSGCLEAVAGGWALLRDARRAAADGLSPHLRAHLEAAGDLALADIVNGVVTGDTECVTLMVRSATAVGDALAMLVSFFNPGRLVLAGPLPQGCPMFLQVARRIVDERALGLATRDLQLGVAENSAANEVAGCARLAVDRLFSEAMA